jgi:hypothetical protein
MKPTIDFLAAVSTWFTGDHISLVSLIVAALALVASIWATLISRKNVKAALRSAAAAEEQAAAAIDQARQATHQLSMGRDAAEVDALSAAKARIDEAAPSVVVILSPMDDAPRILPQDEPIPVPHPQVDQARERTLDYFEFRNDTVYFVHRGMLINDGDRTVRIHASYARFYAGQHPTTGVDVPLPLWSAGEHCHVLEAGQVALFELRVMKRVDVIVEQAEKEDGGDQERSFSRDQIMFLPGNLDEPRLIITVVTYADPFKDRYGSDAHTPLVMRANGHVQVAIRREPMYPQSFEHLHAELRGDEDKLRSLTYFDELRRSLDRRERQGGTP